MRKTTIVRMGLTISIATLILIGFIGTATAEIILFDCTGNTDRPTTQLGYAYSYIDSVTNTITYKLDVTNKPGAEILEYCVYPDPGFTGNTNDLTPLYSEWTIDRPGTKAYFGFDSRSAPKLPVDGSTNIDIGKAKYVDGLPSSEIILLHVLDIDECGGESSCWRTASTSPLPSPTPTPTATVTPTPTVTATPTPTPTGDTDPPTQPLCPVAIVEGPTSINVSWLPSTDNVGVTEYRIFRSTDNTNFYYLTTTTNTNYVDTGLTTGTTYYYAIRAYDAAGNPSPLSDVTYATPRDINPPIVIVPSDIMAEATSSSGAVVTFSASAIDDIDGPISAICNPSSGNTFHLGLTTVTCTARDNAGNIGSTIFTIMVVDTISPTKPLGLVATPVSTSRIDLSWTASYDAVGVTQYLIYRSTDGINFITIGTTLGTTFQNTGLNTDTTYYYYVKAYDRAGHSSFPSDIANARTLAPTPTPSPGPTSTPGPSPTATPGPEPDMPPVVTVPLNIREEATSASGNIVTFSASANDDNDGPVAVTCNPPSGSVFQLGTTIVVCTATDSNNNLGSATFTITIVDTTSPTPPSGLVATAISSSEIDISWTASYDVVGVRTYWIFRGIDGIGFMPIKSTTGTTFSDKGLAPNTTYYYIIVAFDAASNPSDPSNVASARTLQQPPGPTPTPGPSPSPTGTETPGPTPTATPNPCSPDLNTQRGQSVEVAPLPSLGIRFDAVLQCGDTTAVAYYNNQWTPLPNKFKSTMFYDIGTTSTYTNSITINIVYQNPSSNIDENSLRLFHYENGNWVDVTTALDITSNTITGVVSSLSPFGIGGSTLGGSGSATVAGSSFDIIGFIMLSISLIIVSMYRLKRNEKR